MYEFDGNGNVLVYTFRVRYGVGADFGAPYNTLTRRFADYAAGWDWARREEREIHDNDPDYGTDEAYAVVIDYDKDWLPEQYLNDCDDYAEYDRWAV